MHTTKISTHFNVEIFQRTIGTMRFQCTWSPKFGCIKCGFSRQSISLADTSYESTGTFFDNFLSIQYVVIFGAYVTFDWTANCMCLFSNFFKFPMFSFVLWSRLRHRVSSTRLATVSSGSTRGAGIWKPARCRWLLMHTTKHLQRM